MVLALARRLRNGRSLTIASEVAVQARSVESPHVKGSAYHGFFEACYRTGVRAYPVDGEAGSQCVCMVWRVESNKQGVWRSRYPGRVGRRFFRHLSILGLAICRSNPRSRPRHARLLGQGRGFLQR